MNASAPRSPRATDDDAPLDPREALAVLESERSRTQRQLEPDVRLIYGVWGATWLVGFLVLWASSTGRGPLVLPPPAAGSTFAALMAVAVVVTGVHSTRRMAGLRGTSSTQGAMYGWAWLLGFGCVAALFTSAAGAGASAEVMGVLAPALSGLVVGLLYLAGGAMWQDRAQYALGAWILVTSAAGAIAGYPANHLVMGLLGGGGFLVAAVVVAVRGRSA
ncbi:hypothetical protein [uncultured Pseudokineococcus sp.]|uniref:hypothetical protein n=1 Tax=uncultured Pseudokineococcus sp. TaxID=1642928 RepID=UPI00262D546B|nr:hypothetical protein [uncultured Pseudokineococcus sp.]